MRNFVSPGQKIILNQLLFDSNKFQKIKSVIFARFFLRITLRFKRKFFEKVIRFFSKLFSTRLIFLEKKSKRTLTLVGFLIVHF